MRGARVIGQRHLRLALPWLSDAVSAVTSDGGVAPRMPAAEWLATRGQRRASPVPAWRQWLLAGAGVEPRLLDRFPPGPCVYAASNGVLPRGTWACARPVHLLTALDHLRLSPERLLLDPDETRALAADLNRHLDGTGFRLHAADSGEWLVECADRVDCASVEPAQAAGRNLRDLMPAGPDGARVRSLMNELQMLLHEHPVNERRAARALPAVNSLWLWGFGTATLSAGLELPPLVTDDPWLAGLWSAHGTAPRRFEEFATASVEGPSMTLLGWATPPPASGATQCLAAAEATCFVSARAALRAGNVSHVEMLLGDRVIDTSRKARLFIWRHERPLSEVLA